MKVAILGGGPAGVGAAHRLRVTGRGEADVFEANDYVGGNAASFELEGQFVDFGSHRLHPACDPKILSDIEGLLGSELLRRPRHGRIRLRGKWIHFPLKPVDLLLRLDPGFATGAMLDTVRKRFGRRGSGEETFATVLRAQLGETICRDFYFPYARKLWGLEPEQLSATQAYRRVAANSIPKLIRKVLGQLPGVKPVGFSHFFYPKEGFGSISRRYADAAVEAGARLHLGHRVRRVTPAADGGWIVEADGPTGEERRVEADFMFSTLPISVLARLMDPAPEPTVLEAAGGLTYRSMVLIYLTLASNRFTEFDAHYFPGAEVPITRLSETKNYSLVDEPGERTTVCAELPCSPEDTVWGMSDEDLGTLVADNLRSLGLDVPEVAGVHVRRIRYVYPVYATGYERHFDVLDRWASELPDMVSFGRQGLFAHDNTHHALAMSYAAVGCLGDGEFDRQRWAAHRREFESHVVED
ncbi:MAG: FAD-dependent oxidoreductase [Gemmatimonadota bacterium]|nr:FAD-dependent oxidoreductase [Gemmatimonadota bacterium]